MKVDRKIKAEKSPPKLKSVKGSGRAAPKSNGKYLLAAYKHIPVGIVEASLDGKYMDVNEEFCRILGYSRRELLRRGIKDYTYEDDYVIDYKLYEQLIAGKIPFYKLEKRFVRKGGKIIWVELTRSLVCDTRGKPLYTVGVMLDISERKDVERVLRNSTERLRLATGAAQMFMWEWDFQSQSYTLADNFEQVLGFSAGLLPKNSFETVWALSPKEDVQRISEGFQKAVENQSDLHSLPYRVINPENGQVVWLEVSAKIVYDREGKPQRMLGVAQNITQSKKIQDQIAVISRMPEENPNPAMRLSPDGTILYANPASAPLVKDWTAGTERVSAVPEELQKAIKEAFTSGVKTEVEIGHQGRIFSLTLAPIVEGGYVNLYGKDITERKRAEQTLTEFARQQEALYRLSDQLHRTDSLEDVFDAALDAILNALQCDRASILLFDDTNVMQFVAWRGLSDDYRKATEGHSPWKPDEKNPEPIFINAISTAELSTSLKTIIQREGIGSLAFIPLVSNGRLIGKFMVYFNEPHVLSEEELDLSLTIARQLAFGIERKHSEEKLRESEQRFRTLANAMPSIVWTAAPDGTITYANDQWFRYVGITPEENAKGWPELVLHPDDYERCVREWTHALEAVPDEYRIEVRNRRYDGEYRWFQTRAVPARDASGKALAWYGVTTDIHERIEAENRLALLAEISEMLRNVDDPYELMYDISKAIGEHLNIKRALFNEIDLEHDREIVHHDYHSGLDSVAGIHKVSDYSSITSAEVAAGRTVVNADSKTDPRTARDYEKTYALSGERAYVVVPLMRDNRWVASFWVSDDAPRQWSSEEVSLLETVAERTWAIIEKLRINTALRESEQRYRFIVENTSDGIWWVELTEPMPISLPEEEQIDWYYKYAVMRQCNLGLARMYGYDSIQDVVGLPMRILMPREIQINLELFRQFIRSGYRLVDAESRETGRDGHELVFLNNMVGIVEDGKLVGEWGTNRDITERKRAEEALRASESLYRTIARSIPGGGVYVVDKDFRYLVADGPVTEAFGLSREMLEGHTVLEVFPNEAGERMVERLQRNFAGETVSFETAHNGRFYWTQMAPLLDSIGHAIIVTLDITERKKAEEALRQSEERFAQFMRHLPGLAWIKDMDGRYVYANAAAEKAFNTPRDKLYGQTDKNIFPPEVAAQFRRHDAQALTDEKGVQVVETMKHEDGILHYSLVSKFPIPGPDGNTTLIGGTAFDITERLQAEEALRESEERFRAILRQATAGIVRKDAEGRLIFVNEAFCNMLGYTESDLVGKTLWDFMHPDDIAESQRSYGRLMMEGMPFKLERRFLRDDGSVIWVDASVSPIMDAKGKPQSAVAVEVDVTGRKLAEVALRASEQRYRNLFELVPVAVYSCDANGLIEEFNQRAVELWGREPLKSDPRERFCGSFKIFYPDGTFMPHEKCPMARMLGGESLEPHELEILVERLDGVRRNVIAHPLPLKNERGEITGAINCLYDITERKQAEEALRQLNLQLEDRVLSRTARLRNVNQTLREEIKERKKAEEALRRSEAAARENEEKLRTLFDLLPVGISFLDLGGEIIQMNSALANILKLSKEQIANKAYRSRTYIRAKGARMQPAELAGARALAQGKTIYGVETGIVLENGEVIWTSVSAAPVAVADVGAVVVTVDITDSKRAERALRESRERLQILSQRLVEVQEEERRAIARELHDRVGQTLAALNISLLIINGQLADKVDEQIRTRLQDAMKLVAETISLVRDVMSNLRPSVLDDYGLEAALQSHVDQYMSRYEIKVVLDKPNPSIPRLGPSIEMTLLRIAQEALMNIVKHARASEVRLSLRRQEDAIYMTILDNGAGIESWDMANRPGSHGMTIMRERAEAIGGDLKVTSTPGEGTRVEVRIPIENRDEPQVQKEMHN